VPSRKRTVDALKGNVLRADARVGRATVVRADAELASASAEKRACRSTTYVREVPGLSTQVTSMVLTA
jgi:hypothetical protein